MDALSQLAALAVFILVVWIMLLVLGRRAAMAYAELHEGLASWARRRRWVVGTQRWHLLALAAGAERVVESAHGVVGGYDCTILYCTAFESYFVVAALRLPGTSGRLILRRRGRLSKALARAVTLVLRRPAHHAGLPEPAVYDQGFDSTFRAVAATGGAVALLSPQVRRAVARAAEIAPVREVRIVDNVAMIKAETWMAGEHLDALVDALAAVAHAGPATRSDVAR